MEAETQTMKLGTTNICVGNSDTSIWALGSVKISKYNNLFKTAQEQCCSARFLRSLPKMLSLVDALEHIPKTQLEIISRRTPYFDMQVNF